MAVPPPQRPWPRSAPRPLLAGLTAVLMLGVCGAAPPEGEGTEARVGVGFGTYEHRTGGCGGARRSYAVSEPIAHLQVRHQRPSGITWAGEASVAAGRLGDTRDDPTEVDATDDLLEPGSTFWAGALALRGGRHWSRFGLELGPALLLHDDLGGVRPVPSGSVWVGRRDVAYAFADLVTGPFGGAYEFSALVGVGHRSRHFGASYATNVVGHVGEVDLRVGEGVRLGFNGAYGRRFAQQASPDLRAMLFVTLDYRSIGRPDASDAAPPPPPRRDP